MESFQLEKKRWDECDFPEMGWHDATMWSFSANPDQFEFLLDLDYIFKWVKPEKDETYFSFWVAPVTMVFSNVHGVAINIESQQGTIEIADLHRGEPEPTPNGEMTQRSYRFDCQEGTISLLATGFQMFVRRAPQLLDGQSFGLLERGGISFDRELT